MLYHQRFVFRAGLFLVVAFVTPALLGQTTAFTYQGRLEADGSPADGLHDFRFRLFDAAEGGSQVGPTLCADDVDVVEGLFTVILDFGGQFATTAERHLDIDVRRDTGLNCGNPAGFVLLAPRQQITAAPTASHAAAAFALDAADGSPANVVVVDNDGKVGIGTNVPERVLHTVGDAVLIERAANTPAVMLRNRLNGQIDAQFGLESTGANVGYAFVTDQSLARTLFLRDGNAGIGTDAPLHDLHVRDEEPVLILQDSGSTFTQSGYLGFWNSNPSETGWVGYGTPGSPHFSVVNARFGGNIEILALGSGGDIVLSPGAGGGVGIGTSTPSRRLTVWDTMSVEASPGFMPILGIPRPGNQTFRVSMFIDPEGDGVVSGDRKSFREVNPEDPATDIWYVCIEGPEAAMYVRGTARLENGRARIELPSHFRSLAAEKGMTVQLTPLSAQSKGLAVTRKALNGVDVAELADGRGNYEFDWEVKAVRRRYENYQVVKPWDEVLPSDSNREDAWQERIRDIDRDR